MAAIPEGLGTGGVAPAGHGRRDIAVSAPAPGPSHRVQPATAVDSAGVGRFGDLGRRYEERGREWADAARIRGRDRKLGRLADRISDVKLKLEQVKLYPPYPVNESRRAATIREFNGIAAEVERLVVTPTTLPSLSPAVTTVEAERAASALATVQGSVDSERAALAREAASGGEGAATADSVEIGTALSTAPTGITRGATELLRELS